MDWEILNRAARIAANSKDENKSFFLACIALRKDGAFVHSTNNTIVEHQTPSAHAEARVLKKAGYGSILWVVRVLKDKKTWAAAAPCDKCRALIINKGVSRVYYTIGPMEVGIWDPQSPGQLSSLGYDKRQGR